MNQAAITGNRANLVRRGRYLEYFTTGYNSLEGLIAVGAGLIAGSIALVGFGFDSISDTCEIDFIDGPQRQARGTGDEVCRVGRSPRRDL